MSVIVPAIPMTKPRLKARTAGDALSTLFASSARAAVLRLFMIDPTRAYYQRQIESATGLPIRAVQRELDRLTGMGLLYRRNEGNRTYYQVDLQFPLFSELRGLVLKAASPLERVRGSLSTDAQVVLAILWEQTQRMLVVGEWKKDSAVTTPAPFSVDQMSREEFSAALAARDARIDPYLRQGVDVLGRREDVIWRRIEAAGYDVQKGKGVA